MDLFDYMMESCGNLNLPLAARMRPDTLEEIVGQEEIIAPGKILNRAIKADVLSSVILWGPPGTGKTTIARVIAKSTAAEFVTLNATTSGKKEMEEAISEAKNNLKLYNKKTILFIDEIHRFNKGQQDYLLPFVEDGTVIIIGATTENPYFEVNDALISRSMIFKLEPLSDDDIKKLLIRAIHDEKKGLGSLKPKVSEEAIDILAQRAAGDARAALNTLELAVLTAHPDEENILNIGKDQIVEALQSGKLRYDKKGDNHYDTISAFIKSMRGSNPDAAVYYLAKMLVSGEDIKFIARRIIICASEDVGNADPQALAVAVDAAVAIERVGMPEARIILSQAAVYVACAPKSNASYMAIEKAIKEVRNNSALRVPIHLRDAHYKAAKKLGHGLDYKYVHDFPGNYVEQQYLPDEIKDKQFYFPTENGYEEKITMNLKHGG